MAADEEVAISARLGGTEETDLEVLCAQSSLPTTYATMRTDSTPSSVLAAEQAFIRVIQRLSVHMEATERSSEKAEALNGTYPEILAELKGIHTDDPLHQLDIGLAIAYIEYLADERTKGGRFDDHPQAEDPELPFAADTQILPLVKALWTRDYHTIASCQAAEMAGGWAEVTFDRPADAQRMLAVCIAAADAWGDEGFFCRVSGDTPRGGRYSGVDKWVVSARIASHTIFASGTPGLHPLMVSIYLPPDDIERAAHAVESFSGYNPDRWAAL